MDHFDARLRAAVRRQGLMQAMSKELRERDAEIASLRLSLADMVKCNAAMASERDEAKAKLSAAPGADAMERACNIMFDIQGESYPATESTNDDIEIIARAMEQYGDERAATRDAEIARLREVFDRTCKQHAEAMRGTCNTYQAIVAQRNAEIARLTEQNALQGAMLIKHALEIMKLRTPPGADMIELTRRTIANATRKRPGWTGPYLDMEEIARAIQQYGDERAAARDAEIAKLREIERRHLGWCDACLVYHRTGNCPVTGEPPSKEAREGWSLPTPQAAPPGADVMERARRLSRAYWGAASADLDRFVDLAVSALQQYGDERAAAATEAERRRALDLQHTNTKFIELEAEIARLRAPPGAGAMERARLISLPKGEYTACVENIARALQHGDERAAAAREAAISEAEAVADKYADNPVGDEKNNTAEAFAQGMDHQAGAVDNAIAIRDAIHALAVKPERRRCATIDHIDIDLIRREARDAAIEEVAAAIKNLPSCPFDKPTRLKPEEPCPVCGDTGEFNDKPSNCSSPMIAIHALAAKPKSAP